MPWVAKFKVWHPAEAPLAFGQAAIAREVYRRHTTGLEANVTSDAPG